MKDLKRAYLTAIDEVSMNRNYNDATKVLLIEALADRALRESTYALSPVEKDNIVSSARYFIDELEGL